MGLTCLAIIAGALGVRVWDLDGQVSDLTDENEVLAADNESLDGSVSELRAERDSIREIFPISQGSMTAADLEGTYEFLFVPVEGACSYIDCDQMRDVSYTLSIDRTSEGYALALEGAPGPPTPISQEGDVYSTSGVLPESMWGSCDGVPAETSFELHLAVMAAGLVGSDLRAVEASGAYRQYTPYEGLSCAASEGAWTFTARRTG